MRRADRKRAMHVLIGALHNVDTSAGGAGDERDNVKNQSLVFWQDAPNSTASGEQRAAADAIFDEKDLGAGRDAGARAGVSMGATESAGGSRQKRQLLQQQQPTAPAAARTAGPAPAEMAQMEARANDAQLACAEPRVAAAAEPHKRRAVAAGTSVGPAVGVGGKQSPVISPATGRRLPTADTG